MNARADFGLPDEQSPLPWSQELEQAVLGCLLIDATAFDRVGDILKAEDFFEMRHKAAYSTRWRTPFRWDGGQHSTVMADGIPG